MLLFGVGEYPLNGFLAHGINFPAVSLTKLFSQINEPQSAVQRYDRFLRDFAGTSAEK